MLFNIKNLFITCLFIVSVVSMYTCEKLHNELNQLKTQKETKLNLISPAILQAIATIESGNDNTAFNKHTGAVGKYQLRKIIYTNFCGLTFEEAKEESKNEACASLFLYHLMNKYKSNLSAVLQHYNSGYLNNNPNYSKKVLTVLENNGKIEKRN